MITMVNKGKSQPKGFWKTIETIVTQYEFEVADENTKHKIVNDIVNTIRHFWPKITIENRIELTMEQPNYQPHLTISPLLIKEMELYYPEAMI